MPRWLQEGHRSCGTSTPSGGPDPCTPDFLTLLVAPGHNPLQTRLTEARLILPHTWL